jgi:hypothetical protein
MKKLLYGLMMCCTLLLLACGGKKIQGESGNSEADSITERQQYRFEHQFIMADDKNCDSIVVKGYQDGKVAFECKHELVDYVTAENAADMEWINDTTDINFDGIPDLQVYLSVYVRGQVAHLYAGYVWTPQQKFEEVEQWKDLLNPEVHPEDQTVTANYRSDANERTYDTYKWTDGNKLELNKTRKEPFFCVDPQEQEMVAVSAFVEEFYKEWDKKDLLDYGYVKQYITPNLLKYLADEYDYDCEGECLATWKFFYEGGGDVSGLKSRQITARDGNHVLVENNYENYEYDVLLTLVKDGDTFKIDSLKQVKSEYTH